MLQCCPRCRACQTHSSSCNAARQGYTHSCRKPFTAQKLVSCFASIRKPHRSSQCAAKASKRKREVPEQAPDNGVEERKQSNAEAGSSGHQSAHNTNSKPAMPNAVDSLGSIESFSFIESRDSVKSFSHMQLEELQHSVELRRNRIFLLMEEVRRLRIQQRIRGCSPTEEEAVLSESYPSAIPFLPPLSASTVKYYYQFYAFAVGTIILFGGLLSPALEVNMGLGGTTYSEFIRMMHLPSQLAHVDPIVASFCGGAVGVLSAFMVVEANNAKAQEKKRCQYCEGGGYLTCGNCAGHGSVPTSQAKATASNGGEEACTYCSGTGKVMCTACLSTGKALVTEHDPRMDPFN